ncbi:MAG: alpha-L-fucosidase [Bacteroidota bacterium]
MNKLIRVFGIGIILAMETLAFGQVNEMPKNKENLQWWTDSRFGMFIHFGLYSLPAEHAWYKSKEKMTNEEYQKYFDHFNPDLLEPEKWAKLAKQAGMKYMVITTKHHDGFCLWDSEFTDYKVTNTPYGKDIIGPVLEAFRKEGIRVGLYYSLLDWHHPEYTTDHKHPMRDNPEYVKLDKKRDMEIYQSYMQNQLRELLTKYGEIDLLFMDFSFPAQEGYSGKGAEDWDSKSLLSIARELQPQCLINDRMDLLDNPDAWDFRTPEQFMPEKWIEVNGVQVPWETCQTLNERWTYVKDEYAKWKSPGQIIHMLIETVSKGGNIILNVGPNGRGVIDPKSDELLTIVGDWMQLHSSSVYNCTQAPAYYLGPNGTLLTFNPVSNRLYVHLINYPYKEVKIYGIANKVAYAQFLHDASEIKIKKGKGAWLDNAEGNENSVTFTIPIEKPKVSIPVIEIFLTNE